MFEIRSFLRKRGLQLLILGFLFVAAFCLRLYGIDNPPMDVADSRQYHSALLTRGFYEWLLAGELETFPRDGILEPPILELAASFAYRILGGEHLWIPRFLSAVFWMIGGVFLYLIAKQIISPSAALFSVFFFLFVPYGVFASRAFMPDPLMVMLLLISIFAILRYHEQPSTRRLVIAAVASSLAVFVKPVMCLFQLFVVFISLAVYRRGVWRSLTSLHLPMFMALSVLPTAFYYLYGMFYAGFLQTKTPADRFVPGIIFEEVFWVGWGEMLERAVGYTALAGALLGALLLFRKGLPRAFMLGLWGGYFLFGLVFAKHVHTHQYYSLQFIPVAALSLSYVVTLAMNHLFRAAPSKPLHQVGLRYYERYGRTVVLALVISALVLSAVEYKQTIARYAGEDLGAFKRHSQLAATYQDIGENVNHSRNTLFLEPEHGWPLEYHGQISGQAWPPASFQRQEERLSGEQEKSIEERFDILYSQYSPEYFIITRPYLKDEEHEDLRNFLTENFTPTIEEEDRYIVFDLSVRHNKE